METQTGQATAIGLQALSAQWQRLRVTAANIANARTTRTAAGGAYRPRQVVFESQPDPPGGVRPRIDVQANPTRLEFRPDHPDARDDGFVEMPNVDLAEETVELVYTRQAFTANLLSVRTSLDMQDEMIDLLR